MEKKGEEEEDNEEELTESGDFLKKNKNNDGDGDGGCLGYGVTGIGGCSFSHEPVKEQVRKSDSDVKKDAGDGGYKDTDVSVGAGLKEAVLVCVLLILCFIFGLCLVSDLICLTIVYLY